MIRSWLPVIPGFYFFFDFFVKSRINGGADQRFQGIFGNADSGPHDKAGYHQSYNAVYVYMKETENQEGDNGGGSGDYISHSIGGSSQHDLRVDAVSKLLIKGTKPQLDADGENQDCLLYTSPSPRD